ncbi:ankyrin repeat domain-containing protein [Thiotrichales bacterium 19X7-9]|nr:ankyrin repeat domain-containing protein [Thiotrichales bacterium 19X7-9]MCF6774962.1 ankyrin repeat domain-containing protein [Thiotrichales bacterium 19X7-9]
MLHIAAEKGYFSILERLLRLGVNITLKDNFKRSALSGAKSPDIISLLKKYDEQIPVMPFSNGEVTTNIYRNENECR